MKKTLFALLLSFSVIIGYGQTTVTIGGGASITCPSLPNATYSGLPSGISITNWSRGVGVNCSSAGNGLSGSNFNSSSYTSSLTLQRFYSMTITSTSSTLIYLKDIIWNVSVSSGTAKFTVAYSLDGGNTKTTYGAIEQTNSTSYTFTANIAIPINAGSSVILYFIPSNTSAAGTTVRLLNGSTLKFATPVQLPVELSMFRGEEQYLLWTTQSEKQNKGWEIERSIDAKNWTNIGFVEGFENSSQKLDYHFELKEFGKYYYRIKQIDFDGHFEYSEIILHDNSNLNAEYKTFIDLNGREVSKPKANTMYIIPNGGKIMYIEK